MLKLRCLSANPSLIGSKLAKSNEKIFVKRQRALEEALSEFYVFIHYSINVNTEEL